MATQVGRGADVLIVHPKIVATGLDLLDFPTLLFYQIEYSTYTMRQASRRSWRIGQQQPIDVYHFAYRDTLQERALYHIARKTQASQMIEGDLGGDGLVALADSESESTTLMLALARSITASDAEKHVSTDGVGEEVTLAWQDLTYADLTPQPITSERTDARTGGITLEEMRARLTDMPKTKPTRPRKTAPTATQLDLFDLLDRAMGA